MTLASDRRARQAGRRAAKKVLAWLRAGGREQIQAVVRRAAAHTAARNKARRLDDDFLNRRFTI